MKHVRVAKPKDEPLVTQFLISEFHGRYADRLDPVDPAKTRGFVVHVIEQGAVILAFTREGELVGTLGLRVAEPWFSSAKQITDTWFFVLPEKRALGAATPLVKEAKAIAARAQMPLVMSVSTGDDVERKHKYFNRLGFSCMGGMYQWRP